MMAAPSRALGFGFRFCPTHEEAISRYLRPWVLRQPLPDTAGIIYEAGVYEQEPKDLAADWPRLPKTHDRFFFTKCKRQKAGKGYRVSRTVGAGSWVSNGKKEVKNRAGMTIGFHETLRYVYKDKSRESAWLMDEYHCCGLDEFAVLVVDGGMEEHVLCKIHVPLNLKPGSVTLQQSFAGDRRLGAQRSLPATMAVPHPQAQAPQQVIKKPATMAVPRPQAQAAQQVIKKPAMAAPISTQQASKRPAPPMAEPPRLKRMRAAAIPLAPTRPAVKPASAAPPPLQAPPRQSVVSWNSPKRPSWCPPEPPGFLTAPQPQARRPRKSNRAPTKEKEANLELMAEEQSRIQQNAHDDDEFVRLLDAQLEADAELEAAAAAKREADIDEFARLLDAQLEAASEAENGEDADFKAELMRMLDADEEVLPEKTKEHVQGKTIEKDVDEEELEDEDEEEGHHQCGRSLEGLVADERGDEVIAQDVLDVLEDISDIDCEDNDWLTKPLSEYPDIPY